MDVAARQKLAVAALLAAGTIGLGVGLMRRSEALLGRGPNVEIIEPKPTALAKSDPLPALDGAVSQEADSLRNPASGEVVVHVCGQVVNPGVYHLKPGSRIEDAIKAAGGAKQAADQDSVNLAARAQDGEQIYLPKRGEVAVVPPPQRGSGGQPSPPGTMRKGEAVDSVRTGTLRVNINSASAAQLDQLPGVGPATASKIIEYRKAVGGFVKPDDLMNVPGIGEKKFADMREFVVVR